MNDVKIVKVSQWALSEEQCLALASKPDVVKVSPERLNQKQEPYISGTIDMAWIQKARKLGAGPLWVALLLIHKNSLSKGEGFKLTNTFLEKYGVSRSVKSRGLKALAKAGLVKIEDNRTGKNPTITLVGGHYPRAKMVPARYR